MPDMDGIELLRAAREIYPEIGIVIMTAFGTIDTAREAFRLGADDFITKPFNNEELKLIIQNGLERRFLMERLQEKIAEVQQVQQNLQDIQAQIIKAFM